MAWLELKLDTTSEAVDWVCTVLATTPFTDAVQIAEYVQHPVHLADAKPDDERTQTNYSTSSWDFTLCFYLPYERQVRTQIDEIEKQLSGLHRSGQTSELQIAIVDEKLPVAEQPISPIIRVGQRFVIIPPNSPYRPDDHEISLILNPSLTFGRGSHFTTQLILQLLDRYLSPGMKGLDLGSGSGILSIAMARLGATVLALDNDPVAVEATQNAIQLNGVSQQVTAMEGSLGYGSDLGHWMGGVTSQIVPVVEPRENFDLIVANVMARVQVALAPDYQKALCSTQNQPGLLLLSGFTQDYEMDIDAALTAQGFEQIDSERWQEWVALAYQLRITNKIR